MIRKKYTIIPTEDFKKDFGKLSSKHQKMVLKKLRLLEVNPRYPSLRTKKILGCDDGRFESSVNMDIRIFWRFEDEKIIVAINVGHHDILKRY
ncbi:MAG: hypothetical protein LBB74_06510 [Chitinispirillales bacterium]|jgi:mRNA-degrading endonuclease RelE of RelBE toxin-antitoxin system|nr:hypothetical protein [Chitinispirillales bacterium]